MLGELDINEIEEVLKNNTIGHLGCSDGADVYIVPINYRYDNDFILCYSLEGLKIHIMRKHPSVCFEVNEIKNANEWKCVVINGTYEEITDETELRDLRPHFTEYMLRKRVSLTAIPSEENNDIENTNRSYSAQVFYRIRFNKVSGRFENGFLAAKDLQFDASSIL